MSDIEIIAVTMRVPDRERRSYGILFESVETFTVTGRGVHSRGFPHVVQVWEETDGTTRVVTAARSVIIAATPVERPPCAGNATMGGYMRLRYGQEDTGPLYILRPRSLDNPKLEPVTCNAHDPRTSNPCGRKATTVIDAETLWCDPCAYLYASMRR